MCGISGSVDATGAEASQEWMARRMALALAHRGPEDQGIYISPFCTLGHRRLKIIDLTSSGQQPLFNEDHTVCVSFNGEIYNYRDLRDSLINHGHIFRTQTDTEVLVHLYEEKGERLLLDLNGMFALALWDVRRKTLLLARDRFGKKPLYYYTDGKRLVFGSELKALLADGRVPREIDPNALSAYLQLGYIPQPLTIFKNIRKLPAATSITIGIDQERQQLKVSSPRAYWRLLHKPNEELDERECVSQVRELLRDAVKIRLSADVPVGAFLSGGLDSSAVVSAMSQVADAGVNTFTVGFEEESFDESQYAEKVARHCGTSHKTVKCTPDVLETLPRLAFHYDEPFADSSAIPTYCLCKVAREHTKVILSGDGGDEVFAGYTRYQDGMKYWRERRGSAGAVKQAFYGLLADIYPVKGRGWGLFNKRGLSPLDSFIADLFIFQPAQMARLVSEHWATDFSTVDMCRELAKPAISAGHLSAMQSMDMAMYLPDDILVKVDRASMAVALEVRCPLLDYRLAEFMATVPERLLWNEGTKKYVLKQVMKDALPAEILARKKMGFAVPLSKWLHGDLAGLTNDVLDSKAAKERGFFDMREVQRLLRLHNRGHRDVSTQIWTLLFFELWCQNWLGPQAESLAESASQVLQLN
jgi:asparagine synthase (glutamine-hydrolysing)